MSEKTIIGLIEEVIINSAAGKRIVMARIDTGATKSSIDSKLAADLKLGPIMEARMVKSAHGDKLRPVIEVDIILVGRKLMSKFTVADRSHMKYKVLIGQNTIKEGFLIDASKKPQKSGVSGVPKIGDF